MSHPKDENTGLFKCIYTIGQGQGSLPYEDSPFEDGESGRRAESCYSHDSINYNALEGSNLKRLLCNFQVLFT